MGWSSQVERAPSQSPLRTSQLKDFIVSERPSSVLTLALWYQCCLGGWEENCLHPACINNIGECLYFFKYIFTCLYVCVYCLFDDRNKAKFWFLVPDVSLQWIRGCFWTGHICREEGVILRGTTNLNMLKRVWRSSVILRHCSPLGSAGFSNSLAQEVWQLLGGVAHHWRRQWPDFRYTRILLLYTVCVTKIKIKLAIYRCIKQDFSVSVQESVGSLPAVGWKTEFSSNRLGPAGHFLVARLKKVSICQKCFSVSVFPVVSHNTKSTHSLFLWTFLCRTSAVGEAEKKTVPTSCLCRWVTGFFPFPQNIQPECVWVDNTCLST